MPDKEKYPHEYWHGDDVHATIAHVRLQGKASQIELGISEDKIKGNGLRTHADLIIMALAHRAGFKVERVQDEPDEEGTPTEKAASLFTFAKRAGRPAGPSAATAKAPAAASAKKQQAAASELKTKSERDAAIAVLQKAWRNRRGKFTSRGIAITAPKAVAMVEVRPLR